MGCAGAAIQAHLRQSRGGDLHTGARQSHSLAAGLV